MTLPVSAQPETTTLNLTKADITTLISTVGNITGKNFVVDPRVMGKVTVISSTPMTPKEVYQTFLAILQVHGYVAVPSGPVIKIVPAVNAKQSGGVPVVRSPPPPGEELVTRVLRVNNVPATQLVPILRPLIPQYGQLAAYAPSNMLIISDHAANVDRIVKVVRQLDIGDNRQVKLIHLNNASVPEVVTALGQALRQYAKPQVGVTPPMVLPDERTNSVVISGDAAQLATLEDIIKRLDQPANQSEATTQVIYLRYARVKDLAQILESYVKGAAQVKAGTHKGVPKPQGGAGTIVSVVASKDTNALVVTAPPKMMRAIKSVIKQLDIRRAQIFVQAVVAEVSASKARQLGVNWAAFNSDRIAVASLPGIDQNTMTQAIAQGSNREALLGLIQGGAINVAGGAVKQYGTSFAALLRALYSDADTNILSTPTLVTLDNQEAEITVGHQVPFLTGSYASTGAAGTTPSTVNPFQTIQREQVGLTLSLTPQINEGGAIQLTINLTVSSLSPAAKAFNAVDLVTNNRQLKTTVSVHNDDTLVLGGLIDNNVQTTERRVPLLGSIPLLGNLFRYRSVSRDKRNLIVFIHPVILQNQATANYYTRLKYADMRGLQLQTRKDSRGLLGMQDLPLLPKPEQASATAPAASHSGRPVWHVRVATFSNTQMAETLAQQLGHEGYDAFVLTVQIDGQRVSSVLAGRLQTRTQAQHLADVLRRHLGHDVQVTSEAQLRAESQHGPPGTAPAGRDFDSQDHR